MAIFTGDRVKYNNALNKLDKIDLKKYMEEGGSFIEKWDRYSKKRDEILFTLTWEDSLENLYFVLNKVKENGAPKIIAKEITNIIRKGRRNVTILTDDNLKYRKVFYNTLENLKKEMVG
ncbi:MAG: hypothetical protein ACOCRX_06825 [Candidatus Woesearchaeota archaeon]